MTNDFATSPTPEAIRASIGRQRRMAETFLARLAEKSRDEPGITRDTYGAGENWGHEVLAEYGRHAGFQVARDAAANTYVTWAGRDPGAPRILIGSHLDSVPHGGNFDGAAGVLAGLVVSEALRSLGVKPRCDIVTMGVRAEESVWFAVSYIGSRAALGTLPDGALEARRVDTGRTLADHIADCGGDTAALATGHRGLDPKAIRAFLEIHIEQAPSLVEAGLPLAICTGIPGNIRFPNGRIVGRNDHVGTPRRFRQDAGMAAADLATALDRLWGELEDDGVPIAITFGRFHTDSAMHGLTTVPGLFHFSLDMRAYDPAVLARLEAEFHRLVAEIEAKRGVVFELGRRASAAVGPVDPEIATALTHAATTLGIPCLPLGSPASHDSAAFAAAGVPVAMLFVRNEHGSHNPMEHMAIPDFLDACAVLALWVAQAGV